MLPLLRPVLHLPATPCRRLVSPALLSRTWKDETVASLRKAAKERGLSVKGSKANLVLRITQHDDTTSIKKGIAPPLPDGRFLSSTTVAPGPGVPLDVATSAPLPSHDTLNIIIPDLAQSAPEPPVKVPYVPDFWNSTPPSKEFEPVAGDLPKMVVVGGISTHHGGGPTYKLETVSELESIMARPASEDNLRPEKPLGRGGLLDDISEDMGIPTPQELRQSFWKLFS